MLKYLLFNVSPYSNGVVPQKTVISSRTLPLQSPFRVSLSAKGDGMGNVGNVSSLHDGSIGVKPNSALAGGMPAKPPSIRRRYAPKVYISPSRVVYTANFPK